jgi:hypothetical protein
MLNLVYVKKLLGFKSLRNRTYVATLLLCIECTNVEALALLLWPLRIFTVFLNASPCSLVEFYRCFTQTYGFLLPVYGYSGSC